MSSLKFGTSGLRGLVTELLGEPAALWTAAFLRYLENSTPKGARTLYIGRDLRSSSPAIAGDCAAAAANRGWLVVDCGALPTPALALAAREAGAPAVMVTGSHIPDDRNGLKFYTEAGEITKDDEAGILAALPEVGFPPSGGVETPQDASAEAMERYRRRYTDFFGPDVLKGLRVGVYQQSSVARDVLTAILADLGAAVIPFERADRFIPVDTEAHRPEESETASRVGWRQHCRRNRVLRRGCGQATGRGCCRRGRPWRFARPADVAISRPRHGCHADNVQCGGRDVRRGANGHPHQGGIALRDRGHG